MLLPFAEQNKKQSTENDDLEKLMESGETESKGKALHLVDAQGNG